jgi:hypothetical protein
VVLVLRLRTFVFVLVTAPDDEEYDDPDDDERNDPTNHACDRPTLDKSRKEERKKKTGERDLPPAIAPV